MSCLHSILYRSRTASWTCLVQRKPFLTTSRWLSTAASVPYVHKKDNGARRVVILGSGWVGFNFLKNLDKTLYDVVVISPRNYFAFTPFLPAVCSGSLSESACVQPIRDYLTTRGSTPSTYFEASCIDVDFDRKAVTCESTDNAVFDVEYDYLVVGIGANVNTFGIKGVEQYAYFLKNVDQAVAIRKKVLQNFESASLPQCTEAQIDALLHFVVVGGGPTGVEVAAELADFIKEDVPKKYPTLANRARVTLIEMTSRLLPMFSESVSEYTKETFINKNAIQTLLRHAVTEINADTVYAKNLDADADAPAIALDYGFVLWASGVGQLPLANKIMSKIEIQKGNRVMKVSPQFKLKGAEDVYVMGDCSYMEPPSLQASAEKLFNELGVSEMSLQLFQQKLPMLRNAFPQLNEKKFDIEDNPPPSLMNIEQFREYAGKVDKSFVSLAPTAQNARQSSEYLARVFNERVTSESKASAPQFKENWAGSLAYIGSREAVANTPYFTILGGYFSFSIWKAAYLRMQASWATIFQIVYDWMAMDLAGRRTNKTD